MTVSQQEIRAYLSPDGQEHFDDIVLLRKLGASPNIKAIGCMLQDLAANAAQNGLSAATLKERALALCDFFVTLRGESSYAIVTAVRMLLRGIDDVGADDLDGLCAFLTEAPTLFQAKNTQWMEAVRTYGYRLIAEMQTILVFDYSSSVAALMDEARKHGKALHVLIPESRALDGGRPFVEDCLRMGHHPHFFPDAAMEFFVKRTEACFIGAETFYADGSAKNTVGSSTLSYLCKRYHKPFYIPTTMLKVSPASVEGNPKRELSHDLRQNLASHWPEDLQRITDFSCPDLDIIEAEYITGYITERGVIPPYAMFGVCTDYLNELSDLGETYGSV